MKYVVLFLLTGSFLFACSSTDTTSHKEATLELPFQIDGIEPPTGQPAGEAISQLASLQDPELLGSYSQANKIIHILLGTDANDQTAVHAVLVSGSDKLDELPLCAYYEMEPYGTDVTITANSITLRPFSYSAPNARRYEAAETYRVVEGEFVLKLD